MSQSQTAVSAEKPVHKAPDPRVYAMLNIPFGAVGGFVSVVLVFMATKHGLTVQDAGKLVAVGMFPHMWKFLWAPVVDTTWTLKRWYMLSVVLCAIGIAAISAIPLQPGNMFLLE